MKKINWIIICIVFIVLLSCTNPWSDINESVELTLEPINYCVVGIWKRVGPQGQEAMYRFNNWKNGYYSKVNSEDDKYVTGSWSIINEKQIRLHEDNSINMIFDLTCDEKSIWLRNTTPGSDNKPYQFFKL